MTTLVALATKDAVALGCDSLATSTRLLVDPFELADYFDSQNGWKLAKDVTGQPVIKDLGQLIERARSVPYYHMTDVDKLFDLSPFPMGAMFTGITSIGNRTIKSILVDFRAKSRERARSRRFTVQSVAISLLSELRRHYDAEYAALPQVSRDALEVLVAGYGASGPLPRIFRLDVAENRITRAIDDFGIVFGGQTAEIQRLVFGVDVAGERLLEGRYQDLLEKFGAATLALNRGRVRVPDVRTFAERNRLFGRLAADDPTSPQFCLPALQADWGDFSEQNAIDCVAYFIGVMREAHRFSSSMPTVGGPIHVGLIRREGGFKFISREEYRHEDHRVQRATKAPDD